MKIHTLDLKFRQTPELIASYVVELPGQRPILVEPGPGATLPTLLEGLNQIGLKPEEIQDVFVTHVHLDHAGAAGWWAKHGATIYAHPRAVPHLVDPSKLLQSAKQIYKDQMDELWGEMLPCESQQVKSLRDGEVVKFGKHRVRALDTPGHARHHHAFLLEDVCFTGDTTGMRLPNQSYLSVTAAPPQFDPTAYALTLEKIHELNLRSLYLTHFGRVDDVHWHLSQYAKRVEDVYSSISELMEAGLESDFLQEAYREMEYQQARQAGCDEAAWEKYEKGNGSAMCADGIALYAKKAMGL